MDFTEEGIVISSNEEHAQKQWYGIDRINEEIVILLSTEQSLKAHLPIDITEEGIIISSNEEHPIKHSFGIEVTAEEIFISVSLVQLKNDFFINSIFGNELNKNLTTSIESFVAAKLNGE